MDATRQRLRTTRFAAVTLLVTSALLLLLVPVPSLAGADPPTVEITLAPTSAPPHTTASTTARFSFESGRPSAFRCKLNGPTFGFFGPGALAGNWAPCEVGAAPSETGEKKYTYLWLGGPYQGPHTFCVKAVDNVTDEQSEEDCHSWEITPPRPSEFNPELSISASTYGAAAHPDFTTVIEKPLLNRCTFPPPPYNFGNECEELYLEQNFKRVLTRLPPGLVADVNAAPFCDPYNEPEFDAVGNEKPRWRCRNEEARVGTVAAAAQLCDLNKDSESVRSGCSPPIGGEERLEFPAPPGTAMALYGVIYNARPRTEGPYAGEQGHLVVLWPQPPDRLDRPGATKIDLSVTVRENDAGLDFEANEIPDIVYLARFDMFVPGQISQMKLNFEGRTGIEKGHPLVTNPTFCDRQSIDAEFQGYAQNSWREWATGYLDFNTFQNVPYDFDMEPGTGVGNTVSDSVPYAATGCNGLPFAPTFTASVSTDSPGATPEITTVITQKPGEATTKKSVVTLPKGTGLNLNNKLKTCPADALARKDCPESSRVATAEAESKLLPIGETLKGNVYLTGQRGGKLTMSLLLKGFVDLRIDGTSGVENDTITLAFDNQPALPTSKLTFKFEGGDKSLITNPRKCGSITTTANFTSHSGKTHAVSVPMQVKGCSNPTFDVDLSEPAKGKRTAIELVVDSNQKPIKELKFGLDHRAKVSCKGLGKRRKFGELSVTSEKGGAQEAELKRPKRAPCKKKNKRAFDSPSILGGMKFNLYRKRLTRKKPKIFKHAKNKRALRKKTVPKLRASLKPLPSETTSVTLTLNPSETKFLRNPRSCKVNFLALVKTTDGVKYAFKEKLKLRGKGCGKKKKKK